ncbi:MAG: hypothetical protein KC420_02725 [Myxococcales bacterium]|nr:hypothetical protein [Myxococcales bacterium]
MPPLAPRYALALALAVSLAGACASDDGEGGSATDSDSDSTGVDEPVRLATADDYRPLAGAMVSFSKDPTADGAVITIKSGDETFEGAYDGKAWVVFDGVPAGAFQLHWRNPPDPEYPGAPGYYWVVETDLRDLYTGRVYSGRPEPALATSEETRVELSVDAMTPYEYGDRFELYSYNADALLYLDPPEDLVGEPVDFDEAIDGWQIPWSTYTSRDGSSLIDPGAGDDLWLTHLQISPLLDDPGYDDPWFSASLWRLHEAAPLTLPAMIDGATTPAQGSFVVAPEVSLVVDLRATQFSGALAANVPNPEQVECDVSLAREPGEDGPVYGMLPTLAEISVSGAVPPDRVLELVYGDPFPVGEEVLFTRCIHWHPVVHPATGDTKYVYAQVETDWSLAALGGAPVEPRITLVRDVMINGAPLPVDATMDGVGETPTITFTPPATGAADLYSVRVRTIDDTLGGDGTVAASQRTIFSYVTEGTSVTLPPGVLEPGAHYYLQVNASIGSHLGEGRFYTYDGGYSSAVTGIFTR